MSGCMGFSKTGGKSFLYHR